MKAWLFAGVLVLNASCVTSDIAGHSQSEIRVIEGPAKCKRAGTRCLVIAISNRHQHLAEFAVEDGRAPPFMAENAYTYEASLKGSPGTWQPLVSSVGDYSDPRVFAKVPPGGELVVAIYYPEVAARTEYDELRVRVRSRDGEDFYSEPFNNARQ